MMKYLPVFCAALMLVPQAALACTPVAKLYEQTICAEDLAKKSANTQKALEEEVRNIAFDKKFDLKNTQPGDDEKEQLQASSFKNCKAGYDKFKHLFKEDMTEAKYGKMCEEQSVSNYDPHITSYKHWKFNKMLFDHYGGNVAFQQAGLEPHGAYRSFINDIRTEGGLEILDTNYTDPLRQLETYLDQDFQYSSEEEARKYFSEFPLLKITN